jgi:hypothetical protein
MNTPPVALCLAFCCIALSPAVLPARAAEADGKSASEGWVVIESGSRPAYVGIHGGTAPISLLRASNGLLFAFTGQTGNDFLHVLRGNATNVSGVSPAAPGRDTGVPQAVSAASFPNAATPAAKAAPSSPDGRIAEGRKGFAPSAQASMILPPGGSIPAEGKAPAAPALAQGEACGQASLPSAPSDSPLTRMAVSPVSAEAIPAPPDCSPSAAPGAAVEAVSAQAAVPPAVEAILADVPAGGPSLVFASGELAHVIVESHAFVPFGFPLPGESADEGEKKSAVRELPSFTPLKLRDYRPILRYTGGV